MRFEAYTRRKSNGGRSPLILLLPGGGQAVSGALPLGPLAASLVESARGIRPIQRKAGSDLPSLEDH